MNKNTLIGAAVGYVAAVITGFALPEVLSLMLPAGGAIVGSLIPSRLNGNTPPRNQPYGAQPMNPQQPGTAVPQSTQQQAVTSAAAGQTAQRPQAQPQQSSIPEGFESVVEYLQVLEDMIISEGQKNNLDSEIVDKSLALFARIQRVIPLLNELGNSNINHTVRRLVLKDLNAVINPFLRLSGEMKSQNRRMLLNGLRDVNSKITDIVSTVEHKDLLELQTKAELIHQRYKQSEL
ncbi:hypothetical protein PCCS19_30800 [Paenibacillus sp. CCS19]|uniref:hypothetical protein n=1 Tax=Paenibacillus sp. CCS19 TaxID=3158387 RepID=UPI002566CA75|nr:hypothetical protein [Paenibacillus cellulosilyticus]GMK40025.1 hypothetical protein PCCS19_30800 [Paenibacillus cellulosilyticus]